MKLPILIAGVCGFAAIVAVAAQQNREGERGPIGRAPAATADELADTLMAFDRNKDGRLERAEVPERFQGLFDRADGNQDGLLTREELKQTAVASTPPEGGRRGGREDGREGGFGRGRRGGIPDPLLRALDTDRDGSLSAEEIAGAPAALATLDTNADGRLSNDELRPTGRGREDREGREEGRR